jgi:hypothetical protein
MNLIKGFQTTKPSADGTFTIATLYAVDAESNVLVSNEHKLDNNFDCASRTRSQGVLPAGAEFIGNYKPVGK